MISLTATPWILQDPSNLLKTKKRGYDFGGSEGDPTAPSKQMNKDLPSLHKTEKRGCGIGENEKGLAAPPRRQNKGSGDYGSGGSRTELYSKYKLQHATDGHLRRGKQRQHQRN